MGIQKNETLLGRLGKVRANMFPAFMFFVELEYKMNDERNVLKKNNKQQDCNEFRPMVSNL